jgi:hypothetical protein
MYVYLVRLSAVPHSRYSPLKPASRSRRTNSNRYEPSARVVAICGGCMYGLTGRRRFGFSNSSKIAA